MNNWRLFKLSVIWNPKIYYNEYKSEQFDQLNTIHKFSLYFCVIHFNITLESAYNNVTQTYINKTIM
jgi:hypothetical protein